MEMELCSNEMEHKFSRKMNAISEFLKKFKSDPFEGPVGTLLITTNTYNPKLTQTNYLTHDPRFLSSNLCFYVYILLFITKK